MTTPDIRQQIEEIAAMPEVEAWIRARLGNPEADAPGYLRGYCGLNKPGRVEPTPEQMLEAFVSKMRSEGVAL